MHRDKLFTAAYLATANATTAIDLVAEVTDAPAPLAKLIHNLEKSLPRSVTNFSTWDRVLRNDLTTASYEPEQDDRHAYLWELKRQCLANTLQCISTSRRLAFIVVDVLGVDEQEALSIFGIVPAALRLRVNRARASLEGYLGPRCGHLNPANPCSCRGRLGVALRDDVLRLPVILSAPSRAHDALTRRVPNLYRDLGIAYPGSQP